LQRHLREEGRAFTTILRSTRVAAAQDLLRDPTRTVTDVAYLTGFADTAHFTRTFKQAIGATPSAWRATQPNRDAS
ncbi:MAG: helix-turn-helix transcriptional regulator, partial [Actinomycetia bacterium]|nr:helix-turn-helix transcriptional regulator [Actinomycetes bacterium]